MSRRSIVLLVYALLALGAAVVFFLISIDHAVYAPGGGHIDRVLQHHAVSARILRRQRDLPAGLGRRELDPRVLLRKAYSIVAFTIVGLLAAPVIPRRLRLRVDTALIAGFSTLIEIAQKLTVAPYESLLSETFDVGCGAVGGLAGAYLWNALSGARARRDRAGP